MGDLFVPSPPESDFLVVMESLQRGLPQDLDIDTLQVCAGLLCYVSYILIGKMYIIDVYNCEYQNVQIRKPAILLMLSNW